MENEMQGKYQRQPARLCHQPPASCDSKKLVIVAMSLEGLKNEFQIDHLQPYSSTNPENMAKIALADLEVIGLTGIAKDRE